jgi:RNA polymerase sigma factor (sigma-70 family)
VDSLITDAKLLLDVQSPCQADREAAWATFELRYRPVIRAWCSKRSLQPETAEDLTQEILLKLSEQFLRRCYDPDRGRFRSWLKAVVSNALTDYWRARQRRPDAVAIGGTDHGRLLAELASPESAGQLSEVIATQPVTRAALAVAAVRGRVAEAHWKAFYLYHAEGRPVEEVAAEVGLGVGNVYKILQRIKKQIEEEVGHG